MARTPHAVWDDHGRRHIINWRFPVAVQPLTGKFFRDRFPRNLSPQQAAQREAAKLAEFYAFINAAKARLGTAEGKAEAMEGIRSRARDDMADVLEDRREARRLQIERFAASQRGADERALTDMATRLGIEVNLPTGPAVYTFPECINELWIPWRRRHGKAVDEPTVKKLVRTKVNKLVAYLGHDNMRKVTRDKLEAYFDTEFPGAATGTIRDHIIQIKSLFKLAADRQKIPGNPAQRVEYSKDNDNPGRPFMPSERNAIIGAAWECEDEAVKWLWLLGCMYGPRIAEFAEGRLRDVVCEDGIPIFFLDRLHRQGSEKRLKTTDSKRWLPIHSALRTAFMARVTRLRKEHGEDGPLFPELKAYAGRRNKSASNRANQWLDKLVAAGAVTIADPENKSYHSLRHTVSTALKGRPWADFITGHAARNTKGKVYEHPPLPEVVNDVESLQWPL